MDHKGNPKEPQGNHKEQYSTKKLKSGHNNQKEGHDPETTTRLKNLTYTCLQCNDKIPIRSLASNNLEGSC